MKTLRVLSLVGLLALTAVPFLVYERAFHDRGSTISGNDPLPPPPPWEPAGSLLVAS